MKILTAFFKYDYGITARGESLEKHIMFPSLVATGAEVVPFWLEENGYPDNLPELQINLLNYADEINPDIIFFILLRDEINLETLKKLKLKYITINWFCDDQWRFNDFTVKVAPSLSYSITVDKYSLPDYYQIGCRNVLFSQWATNYLAKENEIKKPIYMYDISFVGGRNITREWIVYELKKAGYRVECFGAGWDNGRVSFDEMNKIFLASQINLNLSNSLPTDYRFRKYLIAKIIQMFFTYNFKDSLFSNIKAKLFLIKFFLFPGNSLKNVEQIKARNFEIPGCGGFELSQYAPGIEDYYIIGSELAIYGNIDDLKVMIKYYLFNDNEREKIRLSGYERTKVYTYKNQFIKILRKIKV